MENLKRILLIVVALMLIGGSVYGSFYFLKKYVKKSPEILVDRPIFTSTTTTQSSIAGLKRDQNNKIPSVFSTDLLVEKDVVPVESFSVRGETETQYTYRYITKLSADENYKHFFTFASTNKWKMQSNVKFNSGWSINFSKQNESLSLLYSFNTLTKNAVMDITLSIKN